MDLRLLHGVSYGHTWFGRWGYKFCHGSYGVSKKDYKKAVKTLGSLRLDRIIQNFCDKDQDRQIKCMAQHYRDPGESQLVTIRDLFKFMLSIRKSVKDTATPKEKPARKLASQATLDALKSMDKHIVRSSLSRCRADVYNDVAYLYDNILLKYQDATTIQHSEVFLKKFIEIDNLPVALIVRCKCRVQYDDGGRMILCDICDVWLHTVCCLIDYFLRSCHRCLSGLGAVISWNTNSNE